MQTINLKLLTRLVWSLFQNCIKIGDVAEREIMITTFPVPVKPIGNSKVSDMHTLVES